MIKVITILAFFFIPGCEQYKVPIETKNHPASSNIAIFEIELSPILDIDESNNTEDEGVNVHPHH